MNNLKILIVDDDSSSREVLSCMLKDFDNKKTASNGKQAVDLIMAAIDINKFYDVIFLDISMPFMDGIQVLRVLRAAEKIAKSENHTKVIMTTGLEDEKTIRRAFKSGADAYLLKPLILGDLLEKIELVMGYE